MGVRFVIGRAGSGKTRWCLERILQSLEARPLGPVIYWIVPGQATFQTERELALGDGRGGYFRVRVVSFDDLGREIMEECGGTALGQVTHLGRKMILGHLLRRLEPRLKFFQKVAHQPGVAMELDSTFSELERCGEDVGALCKRLAAEGAGASLGAKLHDLELIHAAYSEFLGQDRLDPQRRLNEALASMGKSAALRDAEIYVDGFYDFSDYERRVLAGLGKICKSVSITLMLDPDSTCVGNPNLNLDELSLFHRTEMAYQRLWFVMQEEAVRRDETVFLREGKRFVNPALARLEKMEGGHGKKNDGIELIEAPDRAAEVDAVARRIGDLTREGGVRCRDIAVLMRSGDEYDDLIAASFGEHGIPFFVDRRRTAAHHPLLQFVRAAMSAAKNVYPHDAMMTLIKSGLLGLEGYEGDELENYVLLHGIKHGMWVLPSPWTGQRGTADLARIESLRRKVIDKVQPFVQGLAKGKLWSVGEISSAIFKLLEDFQVRGTIVRWMGEAEKMGRYQQQAEHERVWDEMVKLFDELVDLLGKERVTLDEFQSILEAGLESFDLALTPATVDQVLVGPVDRTRTPAVKICFVLGLNEGQFPRLARESSVFSDADRRKLRERKIDIEPDTQRLLLDERLLGYVAFTRASEKLYLTRATADEAGKAQSASPFWREVVERFEDVKIDQAPREEQLPVGMIATPRQLITSLMRWVRRGGGGKDWPALYQWLATHDACSDAVDVMRYRAWKALSYQNEAKLSAEQKKRIFASPLKVQASELESFANCPYQHFARYGLGLKQREHRQVDDRDLSRVYHDVLERLVHGLIKDQRDWQGLSEVETNEILDQLTLEFGKRLRGELMLSSAHNRYLLARIRRTLEAVVAAQRAAGGRGSFRPAFANVKFGGDEKLPGLRVKTRQGDEIQVQGKIDRIDVGGENGAAAVIDYKLSSVQLKATEIFHGLSLQLLVHLLALEQIGEQLAGKKLTGSAAFYVQLLRWVRDEDPAEALSPDDPRFNLLVKPRGIFDAEAMKLLDGNFADGKSEVVAAYLKKDGTFGYREESDVAEAGELAALLERVREKIGEIAGKILEGEIGIRPYRLGRKTPCPRCEFRDVCRFDPGQTPYLQLQVISRDELLKGGGNG